MTKCPHCGFDPAEENIHAEGFPCGVDDCHTFCCCQKTWEAHCKTRHPDYYKTDIEKSTEASHP